FRRVLFRSYRPVPCCAPVPKLPGRPSPLNARWSESHQQAGAAPARLSTTAGGRTGKHSPVPRRDSPAGNAVPAYARRSGIARRWTESGVPRSTKSQVRRDLRNSPLRTIGRKAAQQFQSLGNRLHLLVGLAPFSDGSSHTNYPTRTHRRRKAAIEVEQFQKAIRWLTGRGYVAKMASQVRDGAGATLVEPCSVLQNEQPISLTCPGASPYHRLTSGSRIMTAHRFVFCQIAFWSIVAAGIGAGVAWGQLGDATVVGRVQDSQGAVIIGAHVEVKRISTNQVFTAVT